MSHTEKEGRTIIDIILELDKTTLAKAYMEYNEDSDEKPFFNKVREHVKTVCSSDSTVQRAGVFDRNRITTTEIYNSLVHSMAEVFCDIYK